MPSKIAATKKRTAPRSAGLKHRDRLRAWLERQPLAGIRADEIEAHFEGMPDHYWDGLTESELAWGLSTIHTFLSKITRTEAPPTMPILDWQHTPAGDGTRLMLCTWDRRGLLAKAAACLSAVHLNIEQARVFTRADDIVLDLLLIRDTALPGRAPDEKLDRFGFLLDGALSNPPRFASVWACSRHKYPANPVAGRAAAGVRQSFLGHQHPVAD